jgi:hypothetical protein
MPLQNRVTPFGDIVTIAQRGLFTGNRGIIHDPATRTLLKRRWTTKAWLICVCDYKGRRRDVMGGRSWTELFFLDEAVALAAGHRPCFFCQRQRAETFRDAWMRATGNAKPLAAEIDAMLHRERLDRGRKRIHPMPGTVGELPDGTVVTASGQACTVAQGRLFRWTERGYETVLQTFRPDGLLTPPSTLLAIRAGYPPVLHPSLMQSGPYS